MVRTASGTKLSALTMLGTNGAGGYRSASGPVASSGAIIGTHAVPGLADAGKRHDGIPGTGSGKGKDASPNERQKKSTPVTNVTTATNST